MPEIHNYYLPYIRTGLGAKVDPSNNSENRLLVPTKLQVEGKKNEEIEPIIHLYGPGDVVGFNEQAIIKTQPVHNFNKFNASLVPFVEFSEPDFLWRFSTHKNNNYWLPWLSLIVLESDREFTTNNPSQAGLPPTITVNKLESLPDLSGEWRWAHVHISDKEGLEMEEIKQILRVSPHKAVCRLMCPRRLKEFTHYTAFVIPTYRQGHEAALGKTISSNLNAHSWIINTDGKIELPYYHQFEFRTAAGGDFETLVRQLQPHPLENIGKRKIDCSQIGYDLNVAPSTLSLIHI